ncbi:MAG: PIG-L family deacetylase [Bacteroidaceae bacterium]|nr:PIG-L family deacetylase [Bacteroidaceae bacterium]
MFENKRIMVVAAHPDDELLGVGATMHKLIKEQGCEVRVIILGEGITSRSDTRDTEKWKDVLEKHRQNIYRAGSHIGYENIHIYGFSDNRFDSHALLDIIKIVEHEKEDFQPEVIFTHNAGDLNIDHQRTFQAVMTATRPMLDESVRTVICFETPSATDWQYNSHPEQFKPNMYFEVGEDDIQAKCEAMSEYVFETREYPHPRSIKALKVLAQYRGYTSGCEMAEAFEIVRNLIKH